MSNVAMKPIPTAVKLDQDLRQRIKHLADVRQRTPHWVMKEAIQRYVDHEEKREAFKQAGLQAWEAYQTTGMHLTHQEADKWLAQLENGNDEPLPKCHA